MQEPPDGVGNAGRRRVRNPDLERTKVIWGRAEVDSRHSVVRPRTPMIWGVPRKDFCTNWCDGVHHKVERGAVNSLVCRHTGIVLEGFDDV